MCVKDKNDQLWEDKGTTVRDVFFWTAPPCHVMRPPSERIGQLFCLSHSGRPVVFYGFVLTKSLAVGHGHFISHTPLLASRYVPREFNQTLAPTSRVRSSESVISFFYLWMWKCHPILTARPPLQLIRANPISCGQASSQFLCVFLRRLLQQLSPAVISWLCSNCNRHDR